MPHQGKVRVLVLGPIRVVAQGQSNTPSSLQARFLALLALNPRTSVSIDTLIDALWGDSPPSTARAALQNQVSRLRRKHGDSLIETTSNGYLLACETDLSQLRELVHSAEARGSVDAAASLDLAEQALALIRGEPFHQLGHVPSAVAVRAEIGELCDSAADLVVEACLTLGLGARALSDATRLANDRPLDEQRAIRLIRALDLAGRRGDALTQSAAYRRGLRTELGLEAGANLDLVEARLLGAAQSARSDDPQVPTEELTRAMAAISAGHHLLISGSQGSGVSVLLRTLRRRLSGSPLHVALAQGGGYRDVAAAPLLDLFEELRLSPDPALGPVGSFVPMLAEMAAEKPVVLMLDDADTAGPSTQMALREAASVDGVILVVGLHRLGSVFDDLIRRRVNLTSPADDPTSLRQTLAGLSEPVLRVLAATEIVGTDAPRSALVAMGAADGLGDALAMRLLRESASQLISFRHPALRDLVRQDTPSGLREELHHTLGRALAKDGIHHDAAMHLLAAVRVEPIAAVEQARTAASQSTAAGAHHDAAHLLGIAVDRTAGLIPDTLELALRIEWGDALRLAGDPRHLDILTDAVQRARRSGDADQLNEALFALLQLGGTTLNAPLDPNLSNLIDVATAATVNPASAAPMRAAASLAYSLTGNDEFSRELFTRAELDATDHATRRRVLPFAYMALSRPDDVDERRRLADELISLGVLHDDRVAEFEGLHLLFPVLMQVCDGDALRACHTQMTAIVDQVGDVGRRWSLLYLSAAIAHLDNELDRCEQLAQSAHAQFAPVAEPRATAALFGQLFGISLVRGDFAELAPFLEMLVAEQPGVPAWNAALSLALARADPARAVEHATRMLDLAQRDATWLVSHLIGGRALAAVHESGVDCPEGTVARYEQALRPYAGLVSWQGTCSYGPVDTTLALLARIRGDLAAAQRHGAAATDQAIRLGAPSFVADLVNLGLTSG